MKINYNSMYKYYLNLKQQVLLRYHRNWTKKADNVANSSGVLSLAILHAKIEIKVINSQFCIVESPVYNMLDFYFG